jgi:putative phosphoesterase
MKVCILTDSHDNIPLLCKAVVDAKKRGAEAILHCGDVVAPSVLESLNQYKLDIHIIHGNNVGDIYMFNKIAEVYDFIYYYGQDATLNLAGKRIFLVHFPHYAKAISCTGDYDLVCCGHSHKFSIDHIDNVKNKQTILVNAGTVAGVGNRPATYVLGDLSNMQFEVIEISK